MTETDTVKLSGWKLWEQMGSGGYYESSTSEVINDPDAKLSDFAYYQNGAEYRDYILLEPLYEEVEMRAISISVEWIDDNGRFGPRGTAVANLYACGASGEKSLVQEVSLTSDNNWSATVQVPKYDDSGDEITYKVTEWDWTGNYKIKQNQGDMDNGFTLALTYNLLAPQVTGVAETVYGKADGTVTGLTADMEYRTADGGYTAVTDPNMTFAAGTYYIRYAAGTQLEASDETEVVIGAGEKLVVTFVVDGTTVGTREIAWNGTVTDVPTVPEKDGFNGAWDVALTGIQQDLTVTAVYTKSERGQVYAVDKSATNALGACLGGTAADWEKNILTTADIAQLEQGKDIYLHLEVQDGASSVSAADKAMIENALSGDTIAVYLEIDLMKEVEGSTPVAVTETGGKVTITVKVPDSYLNKDTNVTRTYQVIRVHDGETTVLSGTFDASTNTFTFETDRFSAYALSYTDTTVPTNGSAKTGDTGVMLWAVLALVSCAGAVAVAFNRKRLYR